MRGANVNLYNENGWTPLHVAIEKRLPEKMIRLLLNFDAHPHMEDKNGKDCCEKVIENNLYKQILIFWQNHCQKNNELRIRQFDYNIKERIETNLKRKYETELN